MSQPDSPTPIRPEDIRARTIERRTFLGRFGAMAGLAGVLGYTAGCETGNSCDTDVADEITSDSDGSDAPVVDADFADPCKTEKG